MLVVFTCPSCATRLEIDRQTTGQQIECPQCGTSSTVPKIGIGPDTTIGGFRIKRLLGKGGMGEVYLAEQLSMKRDVALKILPAHITRDESDVQRFLQEVHTAAMLEHPNIVTAFEAGEDDGVHFLAMAFVRGSALGDLVTGGSTLEERDALEVVRKVACALAYAWNRHRMLHRDIKPANIMLDEEGEPRLMDMGLSKSLSKSAAMTMSGMVMGTPNYMSPEQAAGRSEIDFRADVYSLGATLYHLVSGNIPFGGSSIMETLHKQATESLPDPRDVNPAVSEACVSLLQKMLAKEPRERHASWEALIEDIDRVIAGQNPSSALSGTGASVMVRRQPAGAGPARSQQGRAVPGNSPPRQAVAQHQPDAPKKPKKTAMVWAISGVAAVLLLAGAVWGVLLSRGGKPKAQPTDAASVTPQAPVRPSPAAPAGNARGIDELARPVAEAVAYAKANPDSLGASEKLTSLESRVSGTPHAAVVAAALADLRQHQDLETRRILADLKGRSDALASAGNPAEARKVLTSYSGPYAAETRNQRLTLADAVTNRPTAVVAAPVAAATTQQVASVAQPPAAPQEAVSTDELSDALLRLDFAAAQTALSRLEKAGGGTMGDWRTFKAQSDKVLAMPDVILASFKSDVGKEVGVLLEREKKVLRITDVKGAKIMADRVVRSGGREIATVAESFDLAALSVQEKLARLGPETSPERCVMRGLLMLASDHSDGAQQQFAQAGSPLGKVLLERLSGVQSARLAKARDQEAEKLYAQAAALYAQRRFFEMKPLVSRMKDEFASAAVASDATRRPPFSEMVDAVAKLGKLITVSKKKTADFRKIQDAIKAATANSLIEICDSDVYEENLIVPESCQGVTLRGRAPEWPTIVSKGNEWAFSGFSVRASDVTVERVALVCKGWTVNANGEIHTINGSVNLRSVVVWMNPSGVGVGWDTASGLSVIHRGCRADLTDCFVVGQIVGTQLRARNSFFVRGTLGIHNWINEARMTNCIVQGNINMNYCEMENCTVGGNAAVGGDRGGMRNSIVAGTLEANSDQFPIEYCDLAGECKKLAKPGKGCITGKPTFQYDAENVRFKLRADSPGKGKASDGEDMGARPTPTMDEVYRKAMMLRAEKQIVF